MGEDRRLDGAYAEGVRLDQHRLYIGTVVGAEGRPLFSCGHVHRSRVAGELCGRWWLARARRGRCTCECHRNLRDLYYRCCDCN
jgi:hypothetical protein